MFIPYVPPQDDSLDIHVEDLDSFELSDVYMSDGMWKQKFLEVIIAVLAVNLILSVNLTQQLVP